MTGRSDPGIRIVLLPSEKAPSGEPLDLDGRVLSLTFEDSEQKADKCTIVLDNFDLALFDRKDIVNGCVLEVSWGYPGKMATPRRVVVQKLKGFQQLTLEGVGTAVTIGKQAKTRAWHNVTRSVVAIEVASELGFDGDRAIIDDTEIILDTVNQVAESDAALLRRLANQENFVFYIDGTGLHWHARRQETAPTHVLEWYSDGTGQLTSVSVESDLMRRVGRVDVKGRDPVAKTVIEQIGDAANVERPTLGSVVEVVDPRTGSTALQQRNATSVTRSSAATTGAEAKREADARFSRAEAETVKLTIGTVGDPTLEAKKVIELRGISGLLSGKYYIKEAKHSVTSTGYTTECKLVRDAVGARSGALGGAGSGDASSAGQPQGGSPNRQQAATGGALRPIETVDPRTGATRVEYRSTGQAIGANDPEAKQ